MMRLVLMYVSLCSGSVFTVLQTKRRAEEAVPFTITGIIGILYLFYVADHLLAGFYAVIGIIAAVYLYAAYTLLYRGLVKKEKERIRQIAQRLLTPGMVIFTVLFLALDVMTRHNLVGT